MRGSTHFDNRSFLLNEEANLRVISPDLARTMREVLEADWAKGIQRQLQAWRQRPWREKLMEQMAVLLCSQL